MPFSDDITTNVEFLEQRARDGAQQEMDRSHTLDQKAAGLIAAAIVLVGAGVAFASRIAELHAGLGARALWVVIFVATLVLLLLSLGFATASVWPQAYRVVIGLPELKRWNSTAYLDRDPTAVHGELMQASIGAIREARPINKRKSDRLAIAFGFFAAAIVSIVVLGSAVAIRLTDNSSKKAPSITRCPRMTSPQSPPSPRPPRPNPSSPPWTRTHRCSPSPN